MPSLIVNYIKVMIAKFRTTSNNNCTRCNNKWTIDFIDNFTCRNCKNFLCSDEKKLRCPKDNKLMDLFIKDGVVWNKCVVCGLVCFDKEEFDVILEKI